MYVLTCISLSSWSRAGLIIITIGLITIIRTSAHWLKQAWNPSYRPSQQSAVPSGWATLAPDRLLCFAPRCRWWSSPSRRCTVASSPYVCSTPVSLCMGHWLMSTRSTISSVRKRLYTQSTPHHALNNLNARSSISADIRSFHLHHEPPFLLNCLAYDLHIFC